MSIISCDCGQTFKFFCCFALFSLLVPKSDAQEIKVFNTNRFGIKDVSPSIIIDENSATGDYKVYAVDKLGIRKITPDEIIQPGTYLGEWKLYMVSDLGLKDVVPKAIAEQDRFDGTTKVCDVDQFGLKDLTPSTIIQKDEITGDIKLYGVTEFGSRQTTPFEVIKKEGDNYGVYGVNKYGVPSIRPKRIVEFDSVHPVFGILLLPSIKQISIDPSNSRIRTIRQLPDSIGTQPTKGDWLRSKPKVK
jgi:hypothetical protein